MYSILTIPIPRTHFLAKNRYIRLIYVLYMIKLRYKSPHTQNPFGINVFSDFFVIIRTLHPGKIYPVKNNKKNLLKSENLLFCLGKVGFLFHFTHLKIKFLVHGVHGIRLQWVRISSTFSVLQPLYFEDRKMVEVQKRSN